MSKYCFSLWKICVLFSYHQHHMKTKTWNPFFPIRCMAFFYLLFVFPPSIHTIFFSPFSIFKMSITQCEITFSVPHMIRIVSKLIVNWFSRSSLNGFVFFFVPRMTPLMSNRIQKKKKIKQQPNSTETPYKDEKKIVQHWSSMN